MPKSILVLYCGGTVGMEHSDLGLRPAPFERFAQLVEQLPGINDKFLPSFELQASSLISDSASLKSADWVQLAREIAINYSSYDGFLILMGTDTMPYVASALSFFLENLAKTVLITGSQHPLIDEAFEARLNLLGSLKALEQADTLFEVAVFFDGQIIRGNRSMKVSTVRLDGITSPRFPTLGYLDTETLILNTDHLLKKPREGFELITATSDLPKISCLRVYPDLDTEMVMCALREPVRGLVLETYGSGTAPRDRDFLHALERATRRGVVIVNTTQCLHGRIDMGRYEISDALRNAGVISGEDMTSSAAYSKLFYLFSKGLPTPKIQDLIALSLRGELSPIISG